MSPIRSCPVPIRMLACCGLAHLAAAEPDPFGRRVDDLISRMTLEEKASQLVSWPPGIPRLGIPAFVWDNEGKHALVSCFPASIGLAATWNPELVQQVASAISDEARALNNRAIREGKPQRHLCFWAPTVNMARDPRWGRVNETYGEDPWLASKLAVGFIRGMQGDHPRYLKAAAGVNHFAVYSEERDRHSVDAVLRDERLLRDYYLPHFEACVIEGRAAAVGATNNGLNGVPLCINRFLLTNVLRHEWGFKGFVFSDSASVEDVWQLRRIAPDGAAASAMTIGAGCELNTGLGNTHLKFIPDAVRRGLLDERAVNEALRRVLTVQFRLGIHDPPEMVPYTRIPDAVIESPEHRELAREAARQSIVLLKNERGTLPLDPGRLKRIVVAGPRADMPELGRKQTGSASRNVSALEGIRARAGVSGVEVVHERNHEASVAAARQAGAVVFLTSVMEGEVCDRMNLGLAPGQERQLKDLIATGTPVIVVLIGSGTLLMDTWGDQVPAMLCAWYPGMEGGNAIADVLFGEFNPSGRLPVTFHRSDAHLPPFPEFDIRKGQTYHYCRHPVRWPFGHGLGYTRFGYSNLTITSDDANPGHFTVRADVTNHGAREGCEVAQLYLHDLQRGTGDQPLQELRGFEKIRLKPGETRSATFALRPADFAFHDKNLSRIVEAGDIEVRVGGSSAQTPLRGRLNIPQTTVLRRAAEFHFSKPSSVPSEVAPDEPLAVEVDIHNSGGTTGIPVVLIDNQPHPCEAPHVGPGETRRVRLTLRLHLPGRRELRLGDLPPIAVTVKSSPARIVCEAMDAPVAATTGEPFRLGLKVRNAGGEATEQEIPLLANGAVVGSTRIRLAPGEESDITLNHRFDQPGLHQLSTTGLPPRLIQTGSPVDSRFRTFANTRIAEFRQSAPESFFIRATGSIGGSWVDENNGGGATRDEYASLYLPRGAGRRCTITLRIDSQELVSNQTKSGIMIRNAITRPGGSDGYLIFGINSYYGGIGNIEWDADADGQLESHAVFDPGPFPKHLAMERDGGRFRFYHSPDQGRTWRIAKEIHLPSARTAQDIGLFLASDGGHQPALATFSGFTISDGPFIGRITPAEQPQAEPEQPY